MKVKTLTLKTEHGTVPPYRTKRIEWNATREAVLAKFIQVEPGPRTFVANGEELIDFVLANLTVGRDLRS